MLTDDQLDAWDRQPSTAEMQANPWGVMGEMMMRCHALSDEVRRLGKRCAVCRYRGQYYVSPVCNAPGRTDIPASGLCDCGHFTPLPKSSRNVDPTPVTERSLLERVLIAEAVDPELAKSMWDANTKPMIKISACTPGTWCADCDTTYPQCQSSRQQDVSDAHK